MNLSTLKQGVLPLLAVCLFGVYLTTICPTVYLGDSGELTAAAFCLGVPHGSGYPLYVVLGKLFSLLPVGSIAFRLNLMSTLFCVLTVWLVWSMIVREAGSRVGGFVGAFSLAFVPVFWFQSVPAEVYALHCFFVALLMWVLQRWDEERRFFLVLVFAFLTGLSFGNHMQTVMLAPAVFFIIFSGDRKALLRVGPLLVLTLFFVFALTLYAYLPIRTVSGAAIHWGDPDSVERFLAHVTGRSHRAGYVLNKAPMEYLSRAREVLGFVWSQFGVLLAAALWGWLRLRSGRWRVFFVLLIVFDLAYAVFLNIISFEVTPFTLPTCIGVGVLIGVGVGDALRRVTGFKRVGLATVRVLKGACCVIPVILFSSHYSLCDQSLNYTAYEHATNIFRTLGQGDTLFVRGDNYVFPVTYGRLVERMREDVHLYDRHSIIFQMPGVSPREKVPGKKWQEKRDAVEKSLIVQRGAGHVFYGIFGPYALNLPAGLDLASLGVLHGVIKRGQGLDPKRIRGVWAHYATESFHDGFERDFMNREICAYFYFNRAKALFQVGRDADGLKNIQLASRIGYNDTLIHSDMAVFLTDRGFYREALRELKKALRYHEDLSSVYNNWGYYWHKRGDYDAAISFFQKAVALKPFRYGCLNNLGFALYEAGRQREALITFERSLSINNNQPRIQRFIRENLRHSEGFH